jgi:hypothetical protein
MGWTRRARYCSQRGNCVPKITNGTGNYEAQMPARKRVMTTIIATCIAPWSATA